MLIEKYLIENKVFKLLEDRGSKKVYLRADQKAIYIPNITGIWSKIYEWLTKNRECELNQEFNKVKNIKLSLKNKRFFEEPL